MKPNWLQRIVSAILTAAILSSCSTTAGRITASATTEGKIKAGVHLPPQPDDCRLQEAHADLTAGVEVRAVLIRERAALDRQNARGGRCADFYDTLRSKLNTP